MAGQENTQRLIQAYIEGASKKHNPSANVYPLDQVDTFRVFGGITIVGAISGSPLGNRYKIKDDIVHGRFVDAIAYGLQQPGFAGWQVSLDEHTLSSGFKNGYIEKISIMELTPSKELDALL